MPWGGVPQVSGIVATVFGPNGFLGSYVVNEIAKKGSQVVCPYRSTENEAMHLKQMGDLGQVRRGARRQPARKQQQGRIVSAWSAFPLHGLSRPCSPQMVLLSDFNIRSDDEIRRAISRSNVVVNCIGMRLETKNFTFQDVHVDFPTRLAK